MKQAWDARNLKRLRNLISKFQSHFRATGPFQYHFQITMSDNGSIISNPDATASNDDKNIVMRGESATCMLQYYLSNLLIHAQIVC